MRGEFRLHDVTALPAELNRLHVLDGAITNLAPDENIGRGHHPEEDGDAPPDGLTIRKLGEPGCDAAFSHPNADWNENQPEEEHDGNRDEDEQPDVGILHATAHVRREREEPGAAGERHQRDA